MGAQKSIILSETVRYRKEMRKEEKRGLETPIEDMGLSVRVISGCKKLGIKTFGELIERYQKKARDPDFTETFGKKSQREIQRKVSLLGKLKDKN